MSMPSRLWTSIALFAVSLALPAFHEVRAPILSFGAPPIWVVSGWGALALGWFPALLNLVGIPQGHFDFLRNMAWFANPLLLVCWICTAVKRRRAALVCGSLALGFSLLFVVCYNMPINDGNSDHRVVPSVGCWLWIASILVALAGGRVAAVIGLPRGPVGRRSASPGRSGTAAKRRAMQAKQEPLADVARRLFAPDQIDAVFAALDSYTGPEQERVQRAILTLSGGVVGKLSHNVAIALRDYRDVLYWAEDPPSA